MHGPSYKKDLNTVGDKSVKLLYIRETKPMTSFVQSNLRVSDALLIQKGVKHDSALVHCSSATFLE
jgi:hypothetical protein